jgi:hypothetical protein
MANWPTLELQKSLHCWNLPLVLLKHPPIPPEIEHLAVPTTFTEGPGEISQDRAPKHWDLHGPSVLANWPPQNLSSSGMAMTNPPLLVPTASRPLNQMLCCCVVSNLLVGPWVFTICVQILKGKIHMLMGSIPMKPSKQFSRLTYFSSSTGWNNRV